MLVRRFPVAAFWLVAVAIELLLIPLFLFTGADAAVERGLDAAGLEFNTDLVTAARVAIEAPAAIPGLLLALGQVASPDLAVLVVAAWLGRGALREVARRWRCWSPEVGVRRGLRIWLGCVLTFCAMNLASAGLHALGPDDLRFTWDVDPLTATFATGLLIAMFLDAGALFEENGWRGFALPRLQAAHGPVAAAATVGVLWALWHLPVKFDLLLDYGAPRFALLFAVLLVKFVALSVIMSYFFNRAGEATVLAVVMHGLSNDSVRLGGLVESEAFAAQLRAEVDLVLPMLVVAAILLALTRGRLGTGPCHDARMSARALGRAIARPLRRPRAARRLGIELLAALTGAAYAAALLVLAPVIAGLSVLVLGIPLALLALAGCRALAEAERSWAGRALGGSGLAPRPAVVVRAGPVERARRLLASGRTWRSVGWLLVRAAAGGAVTALLALAALTTLALALVPFVDGWLDWGWLRTSAGLGSAWTLLLLPLPIVLALHALDALGSALAAAAPRLLGPDPAEELEALRRRETRLRDRARLAAELHDSIGHTLTVVTLQAAAAARALDDDPAGARRSLAAIEQAGRRAAEQLDGVLAALGGGPAGDAEPGLADLPELVAALRAAGVPAELHTSGPVGSVPAPLGGELYRMTQEACANVLRHAGRPPTVVRVEVADGRVSLAVRNDSTGTPEPTRPSGGRGLPSIAERARRLGGRARAGSTPGGFELIVELPLGR